MIYEKGSMANAKKQVILVTIPSGHIERRIYFVRSMKVMLDSDLAELMASRPGRSFKRSSATWSAFPKTS